jgi:hypothetical protein
METPKNTVKLANKAVPPTYAEPGKPDVGINVGMEHTIFVPSLNTQRAGFIPYRIEENKRVDATAELLAQYPGIYKPIL